jgi:hypothetical protein
MYHVPAFLDGLGNVMRECVSKALLLKISLSYTAN